MKYLNSFLESFKLSEEILIELKADNIDHDGLRATLSGFWDKRDDEMYQNIAKSIKILAGTFC